MKKKNLLLFLLSLILSLSGCTTSRERQFFRFLNSRRIDLTMSIRAEAQGVETTLDFVDIIVYKEFLSISFPTSEKSIIVDSKEGKNYYDSETSGKIMTTFEKEEKPNNMSYYISDIYVENDKLYFSINAKEALNVTNGEEFLPITTDKIDCSVSFANNRVSSMRIDLLSYVDIEMDPSINLDLIIKVNEYGRKVKKPKIDKEQYKLVDEEEFAITFASEFLGDIMSSIPGINGNQKPPAEVNPNNCTLHVSQQKYTLNKGESIDLIGHLKWENGGFINVPEGSIKFEKNIDFNKPGIYYSRAICDYEGYTFKTNYTIEVLIVDPLKTTHKKYDFLDKITNVYPYNDQYILLCDDNKIYKYNLLTDKVEGELSLNENIKDIKVKEEYLYVLTSSSISKEDTTYNSSLTKIEFGNFSLVKQMKIDSLGDSFFVDNRNEIVVPKKNNLDADLILVNLENETSKTLFKCYKDDYFVYKNDKDAFLVVSKSSNNYWVEYKDGVYCDIKRETTSNFNQVLSSDIDGNILVKNYEKEKTWIEKYDVTKQDYVSYQVNSGSRLTSEFTNDLLYTTNNKIYYCFKRDNLTQIIEYNISTRKSQYKVIEIEKDVDFIRVINSKVYLFGQNNVSIIDFNN